MRWGDPCSGSPRPETLGTSRVSLSAGTQTFTPGSVHGPWRGGGVLELEGSRVYPTWAYGQQAPCQHMGAFLQGLSKITGGFLEVLERVAPAWATFLELLSQ